MKRDHEGLTKLVSEFREIDSYKIFDIYNKYQRRFYGEKMAKYKDRPNEKVELFRDVEVIHKTYRHAKRYFQIYG